MGEDETHPKRGNGLLALLGTMAAGGAAACAVSWADPFGGETDKTKEAVHEGHAVPAPALVLLDPLVVSLTGTDGARRRAPRLRVVVALETDEDTASQLHADDARLRDGFIAAARALGAEALAGPDGLEALRASYLERARGVLGEEAVMAVLVTDYVMT